MIVFNRNDGADIQEQLTYLSSLPQYKLFRLRAVREQMKTYDFWNEKCIIEFKKQIDHLHQDLSKLERKTDTVIYWIIGGAFTTILTLVGLFNLFIN